VYFVRHNGGSVWFDELGPPWPKHGCFDEHRDEGRYGIQLRRLLATSGQVFGIIIETETTRLGEGGRIMVRCSDGTIIDSEFDTQAVLSDLPGQLVVVARDEQGGLSLRPVYPAQLKWRQYWRIIDTWNYSIENRSCRVVEEFAYTHRAEAEQRLSDLQAQYPGRYELEKDKRWEY